MRSRGLLHKSKLEEFKQWLIGLDFKEQPTKGAYEVLRMWSSYSGVLIVYEKISSTEHYTTHGLSHRLVRTWLATKKAVDGGKR